MPRREAILAAAGTTAASSGGSTVQPIFSDGFANLNKWESLQWSTAGTVRNTAGTSYTANNEYPCTVVAIDGRANVLRFELRDGDSPFGGTERTEIGDPFTNTSGDMTAFIGDERWICWDMKFDSTWPIPPSSSGWNLIWQWHQSSSSVGSPACVIEMSDDDKLYITNNDASGYVWTPIMTCVRNTWQRWIVHVKFSDNPAVGFVEVFVDGVTKVAKEFRRTLVVGDTSCYFKMGTYRDSVNTATAISYRDNFAIYNAKPPELP